MPTLICERTTLGMQAADWYKKVERQSRQIRELLQSWKNSPINDFIDIKYLLKSFKNWNYAKVENDQGDKYNYYRNEYCYKLLAAIEAGLFLQTHFSLSR